jgi:hypothetical protein
MKASFLREAFLVIIPIGILTSEYNKEDINNWLYFLT